MPPRSRQRGTATANSTNNNDNNSNNNNDNRNNNQGKRSAGGGGKNRRPNRKNNDTNRTNRTNRSQSNNSSNNNNSNSKRQNKNSNVKRFQPQPITDDPSTLCMVCANPAKEWAIGDCSHHVCVDCAHRLRVLYKRTTCVICSQEQKHLFVVPLNNWNDSLTYEAIKEKYRNPADYHHDESIGMTFINDSVTGTNRAEHFRHLRGFKCSHKACSNENDSTVCNNANELRRHALERHDSIYCEICFYGEKSFISELPQYRLDKSKGAKSSSSLRQHLKKTHPQCQFCKQYYLDDDKLYAHLQEAHETCSICERNGRNHEYYVNFEHLEQHYQQEHYMCSHKSCRGVVFATAIELQAHLHTQHSNDSSSNSSRSRTLRVNLQQLHEPGRNDPRPANDERMERDRQAARRRAFLSSHVVFSGASSLNLNDEPPIPEPPPQPPSQTESQSQSQSQARSQANSTTPSGSSTSAQSQAIPRPPDDGKFHSSPLPRTPEEATSRNTALVRRMRSLLDPAAYEQFKESSARFSDGSMTGDEYFDAAVDAFGIRAAVRDVLPELVALLPSPLLREPLLQTCLRHTDTPVDTVDPSHSALASTTPAAASSSASSSASTSNNNQSQQNESNVNFPTLNGTPVPEHLRRVPQRLRRFGAPGPEEFPRLARANPPGNPPAPAPSASNRVTNQPTNRGLPSARPVNPPLPSQQNQPPPPTPPQSQNNAAAIVRLRSPASVSAVTNRSALANATPSSGRRNFTNNDAFPSLSSNSQAPSSSSMPGAHGAFANAARASSTSSHQARVTTPSSSSATSSSRVNGSNISAFPALSSGFNSNQSFPSLSSTSSSSNNNNASNNSNQNEAYEASNSDVSLRAGAVWGGMTVTTRKSKKKGGGRRPATPPRVAVERQNDTMSGGDASGSTDVGATHPATEASSSSSGNSSSASASANANASGSNSSGRLQVIDVMEIARDRRRAVEQSALPRIAKSAFSGGRVTGYSNNRDSKK